MIEGYAVIDTKEFIRLLKVVARNTSSSRIFLAIAHNMDPETREFYGTLRHIAELSLSSKSTVSRVMKEFCEEGYVEKISNSVWRITPLVLEKPKLENVASNKKIET